MDPTAVQGKRIGAWLIDFVFAGVLAAVALMVFVNGVSDIPGNRCADDNLFCSTTFGGADGYAIYDETTDTSIFVESDGLIWPVVAFFGYGLVSFVLIEGLAGGSVGKLMLGLRVVRADGGRAGVGYALLRFVLWAVDGAPWCFPLVGLIMGLTTAGHRRLGDMAAGTFVVGVRDAGRPVLVPGLTSTPGAGGPPFATHPQAQPPGTPFPGHRYPQQPYTGPTPDPNQTWPAPTGAAPDPNQTWPAPAGPGSHADQPWPPPSGPGTTAVPGPPGSDTDRPWASPPSDTDTTTGPGQRWPHGDAPSGSDATRAASDPAMQDHLTDSQAAGTEATASEAADAGAAFASQGARHAPVWDPERGTYVQWDAPHQLWLIWDTATDKWKPLS